jgi:acetolactate decarboxylase
VLDERLVTSLHVASMRHTELHAEHGPHVLFQASTIAALLDGAYDGDVTFAELAEHGDLGLGTLNALDGEMIALDGRFYRADVDGALAEIDPAERTPFAVVTWFEPTIVFEIDGPVGDDRFRELLDERMPEGASSCALRARGEFDLIRARSVPRQSRPYRPLAEVVADQHEFEFRGSTGTIVGFRFPDFAEGFEVSGHHLHFLTEDRSRGGHVLACRPRRLTVEIDPSRDLHVELPPGIDLQSTELADGTRAALRQAERGN